MQVFDGQRQGLLQAHVSQHATEEFSEISFLANEVLSVKLVLQLSIGKVFQMLQADRELHVVKHGQQLPQLGVDAEGGDHRRKHLEGAALSLEFQAGIYQAGIGVELIGTKEQIWGYYLVYRIIWYIALTFETNGASNGSA